MAYRKPIFEVTYHYDDDTGMYEMGEIDCGLGDEFVKYARQYGIEKLNQYLREMLPKRVEDFWNYEKSKVIETLK